MRLFFLLLICPVMLWAAERPASADRTNADITVENLNDTGAGSLRQAILLANQNPGEDNISFLPGLTGTIRLGSRLPVINESVNISGPGADKITISGENMVRIMETFNNNGGATIKINGLSFKNAKGNTGAAIRNGGLTTLKLSNCIFHHNVSPNTGAGDGGALGNFITSRIYIERCSFFENMASTFGGALYNLGFVEISNSTFSGNKAFNGSAIFNINQTGMVIISNCTISGNSTEGGSGGGVFADLSSTTYIKNSTITQNRTSGIGSGGGIFAGSASVYMSSSIVAGNSTTVNGPDIQGKVISSGFNLIGNPLNSTGITQGVNNDLAGSSTLPLNPLLGPLQNNGGPTLTHALLPGSPAIDAGNCNDNFIDQRGVTRPFNNQCDIGAFEVAPSYKLNLGPLTIFLGSLLPQDNGKSLDVKADILIGDSVVASASILRKRIAGHINHQGLRVDIPLNARSVSVSQSDSIRVRVSIKSADRQNIGIRLWHNLDSAAINSRGFSRMTFAIDSSMPGFLYLRENFRLHPAAGNQAISASATSSPNFTEIGTWKIAMTDLVEIQRAVMAGRPFVSLKEESQEFKVMPNPAGMIPVFTFRGESADKARIEIRDITGRMIAVKQIMVSGNKLQICNDIRLAKPGMYLAILTLEKDKQVIRRETIKFLAQ